MRRVVLVALLAAFGIQLASPALAYRARVHRGPRRTTVVVHRGFPVRRALPVVVVRPARSAVVVVPALFLAPVVWRAAVVSLPPPERLVWEDAETLKQDDGWTEFTLLVGDHGAKLYLEILGRAQVEFAEVVYSNGDTQVVDFESGAHDAGIYSLLDFPDGRRVSHVRMVARARSDEARLVVRMAK